MSRRRGKLIKGFGSLLAVLVIGGSIALMAAVAGTGSGYHQTEYTQYSYNPPPVVDFGSGPMAQHQSQNSDVDINVDVDNVVQLIVKQLCPVDCPELQRILEGLFDLQNRVDLLEGGQLALVEEIARVERFSAARIGQLAGEIAAIGQQTQEAIGHLQGRVEQIARINRDTQERIGQIERSVMDIEREGQRRETRLNERINDVQRGTDMKISALHADILEVKMDLNRMDSRLSALEQNNRYLTGKVDELNARVITLEARLSDTERALSFLLSHH